MADIKDFSILAANNNSTPPDGAPEGMAPSTVNNVIRELMAAIRRQWEQAEWFDFGDTITYASGTSFTVATDLTARYQVGRRVRATGSTTGTIYGTITASAFATVTTVTVEWDSGSLSNETLAVSVGINSVTNPALSYQAIKDLIAANISYDNSGSTTPLTATDVKAALDELDSNFNTTITSTAAAAAGAAALQYTYSNTITMADPATGYLRLNSVTISSVTAIAIDDQLASSGNPDISAYIATWDDTTGTDKGTLIIRDASDTSKFAIFQVTGLTDNTGWTELTVTYIDGAGSFTNDGDLFLSYFRHGDDAVNALLASNNLSDLDNASTARTNLGLEIGVDVQAVIAAISQATWNTGTSTTESTISPDKLDAKIENKFNVSGSAPLYACRAWVNFDGTGAVSIRASGNVSSITDNGAGDYTVNFGTAMPDANYACNVTGGRSDANLTSVVKTGSRGVSGIDVIFRTPSNQANADSSDISVSINGN